MLGQKYAAFMKVTCND